MNALTLTVFCSFALVAVMLGLFVVAVRRGDGDHEDRLSLLPLDDEDLSLKSASGGTHHD